MSEANELWRGYYKLYDGVPTEYASRTEILKWRGDWWILWGVRPVVGPFGGLLFDYLQETVSIKLFKCGQDNAALWCKREFVEIPEDECDPKVASFVCSFVEISGTGTMIRWPWRGCWWTGASGRGKEWESSRRGGKSSKKGAYQIIVWSNE